MIVYLASPDNSTQAEAAVGMPVLLSYALAGGSKGKWLDRYQATFKRILIDSGAFSVLTKGKQVDLGEYAEWAGRWAGHADAVAGLDDIAGDWRRSYDNYERFPGGFPTFHDTDPYELLPDLIAMARERGGWLGLGLIPPREGKERWVRGTCDRIPDGVHVHGWALRKYTRVRRLDSVDSTNWWRDAMDLRVVPQLAHLTYGECLEIIVKRYQRWDRAITDRSNEMPLFREAHA